MCARVRLPHLARVLDHLLTLRRTGIAPAFAQHLPALGRQLLKTAEILAHPRLLSGRQCLEPLPARAQRLALIRRQRPPARETLLCLATLILRHAEPTLAPVSERLLAFRRQRVPLVAEAGQEPLLLR
jgi:hypothetical protein